MRLYSVSVASQNNTYYTCLNIVNFIDPIPAYAGMTKHAFAGMTKHGCDMRDDDIKRIIKKPPNGGFLIWEKAVVFKGCFAFRFCFVLIFPYACETIYTFFYGFVIIAQPTFCHCLIRNDFHT